MIFPRINIDGFLLKHCVKAGTVIIFAGNTAPEGYLYCNGGAVSRKTYAVLFGEVGTSYGAGDGSTTFNLPNFEDRTVWQDTEVHIGNLYNGHIPNITGAMGVNAGNTYSGALYTIGGAGYNFSNTGGSITILDASRSSTCYVNGAPNVCPSHINSRFYIKY